MKRYEPFCYFYNLVCNNCGFAAACSLGVAQYWHPEDRNSHFPSSCICRTVFLSGSKEIRVNKMLVEFCQQYFSKQYILMIYCIKHFECIVRLDICILVQDDITVQMCKYIGIYTVSHTLYIVHIYYVPQTIRTVMFL